MNRYFIHDVGLVNALGQGREQVFRHWQQGTSPGMTTGELFTQKNPCHVACVTGELPAIPTALQHLDCRNNQLLAAAWHQIEHTAQRLIRRHGANRIGVVLGTSTSGIANGENALMEKLSTGNTPAWYNFNQQDIGTGSVFLSAYAGITGPSITVSTACSSSGNAFRTARRLMELDLCDAVIVGGADSLCRMTVQGFSALESVSPEVCQPFSRHRQGITIGEAAALFVFSREPADIELYGIGCSSDAHHISAPDPSGHGACRSMADALSQSPFHAADVDYVNLHGTATRLNDAMESLAVNTTFGDQVLCSSTKSLTGHTLGAAAATELALCCLLLSGLNAGRQVPAQVWDGEFDPELPVIGIADGIRQPAQLRLCLSNSFAFGGNNVSLLVGKHHESF